MQNGTHIAAVDMGSNSFRLEIGRVDGHQIHRKHYQKETVRQGGGLDEHNNLTLEAMQRGWDCLARFAERLAGFKPEHVRAVATQTLREARNRAEFIACGQEILGFPISVISGHEEARLIYQGVAHLLPASNEKRLVIDIGGRSAELILGQQLKAHTMQSYRTGCVAWSMKYFPQGQLTANAFEKAQVAAIAVLDEALSQYRPGSWDTAYGSSGTVGAVGEVLAGAGWQQGVITQNGLDWLLEKLLKAQHVDRLKIEGLKDDRRAVIGGGVSILRAMFKLFGIKTMKVADGALRQGVLYDMLDREHDGTDVRLATVQHLAKKFDVDQTQAKRVAQAALHFLEQINSDGHAAQANALPDTQRTQRKLSWAAQLHEIGCQISHSEYHKHGAYILDNAEAPGFTAPELHRLGQLVLGQRGKLRKVQSDLDDATFAQQLLCLRLAVILCHARREPDTKALRLQTAPKKTKQFVLSCPASWTKAFPQSAHLLREEALAWEKMAWGLAVIEA